MARYRNYWDALQAHEEIARALAKKSGVIVSLFIFINSSENSGHNIAPVPEFAPVPE